MGCSPMTDERPDPLEEELKCGEGAHVEFKSPTVELTKAGDGMAKILRAIIAFSSTPGEERSRIYLGVLEGDTQRELIVKTLQAIARFRQLREQPELTDDEKEKWTDWIRGACFVGHGNTHIVVLNRPKEFGPEAERFKEQLKKFAKFALGQDRFDLKWRQSSCTDPDPDKCAEQWALRITLPASGMNPNQVVSLRDMGGEGGVRKDYSYVRHNASNEPVAPSLAAELVGLRIARKTMPWLWGGLLTMLLVGTAAVYKALDRDPSYWSTPALIERLRDGLEVDIDWQDIKVQDFLKQAGAKGVEKPLLQGLMTVLEDPEVYAQAQKLLKTRRAIQNRIYRSGSVDTTQPDAEVTEAEMLAWLEKNSDPTRDSGDGHLRLSIAPYSDEGPWVLHGRGYLREYKREGEENNELWGAWLDTNSIARLDGGERVRVDLHLFSCVDETKNDLRLYFHVEVDPEHIWRPTKKDADYFKGVTENGSRKTRVFIEPSAVDMTGEPMHVVNITWARSNE